jgi:hypothetical protein
MIDREAIVKAACRDTLQTNFEDNRRKSSCVTSSTRLKSYRPKDKNLLAAVRSGRLLIEEIGYSMLQFESVGSAD